MSELKVVTEISLTEEQYAIIEKMAATNYAISQIAMFLGISKKALRSAYENKESRVRYHYDRGLLVSQFEINQKLLDKAMSGNLTAVQQFEKMREKLVFENHKTRILNEG